MKKVLSYLLTPVYWIFFGLLFLLFHPVLVLTHRLFGQDAFQSVVNLMNWLTMKNLHLLGCSQSVVDSNLYDTSRPLIIVSNHQSMYDVPMFTWHFRNYGIRFVSKIELASGVPSVSYNLRHASHIVIDRSDRKQAIEAIREGGASASTHKHAVVIFPEGTRSRDGAPKRFSQTGLKLLLETMPDAPIVPVSINNSWRLVKNGMFPIPFGVNATWTVHPLIEPAGREFEELSAEIEQIIKAGVFTEGGKKEEAT